MTILEKINNLLTIIYPEFYLVKDMSGNEFVLLKTDTIEDFKQITVTDKTQTEAFLKHIHLVDRVSKNDCCKLEAVGKKIAQNLFERLKSSFPQKKFVVYLEINPKDSTIIRFHQIWEDEYMFIDSSAKYENTVIFEYRT